MSNQERPSSRIIFAEPGLAAAYGDAGSDSFGLSWWAWLLMLIELGAGLVDLATQKQGHMYVPDMVGIAVQPLLFGLLPAWIVFRFGGRSRPTASRVFVIIMIILTLVHGALIKLHLPQFLAANSTTTFAAFESQSSPPAPPPALAQVPTPTPPSAQAAAKQANPKPAAPAAAPADPDIPVQAAYREFREWYEEKQSNYNKAEQAFAQAGAVHLATLTTLDAISSRQVLLEAVVVAGDHLDTALSRASGRFEECLRAEHLARDQWAPVQKRFDNAVPVASRQEALEAARRENDAMTAMLGELRDHWGSWHIDPASTGVTFDNAAATQRFDAAAKAARAAYGDRQTLHPGEFPQTLPLHQSLFAAAPFPAAQEAVPSAAPGAGAGAAESDRVIPASASAAIDVPLSAPTDPGAPDKNEIYKSARAKFETWLTGDVREFRSSAKAVVAAHELDSSCNLKVGGFTTLEKINGALKIARRLEHANDQLDAACTHAPQRIDDLLGSAFTSAERGAIIKRLTAPLELPDLVHLREVDRDLSNHFTAMIEMLRDNWGAWRADQYERPRFEEQDLNDAYAEHQKKMKDDIWEDLHLGIVIKKIWMQMPGGLPIW